MENYKKGIDSLVFAVCGSGKTEISLNVIKYAIECGEHVAFAVPRRDVVIELYNRLKNIFKYNKVISVYGGHTEKLDGDIVVLTTHQLYRYNKYFALIVLDEIDAFPFKNNEVLNHIFHNAIDGHYIMMSATPSEEVIESFKGDNKDIMGLDVRFHRHPLPVPKIIEKRSVTRYLLLIWLVHNFLKQEKPVFVFAPTIEKCENLYYLLRLFFKGGNFVHSKRENRTRVIEHFRKRMYRYLVTTSVLERGVTLNNLQVIVIDADHSIYDRGTLVQIAGRVGRKIDAPEGEVIFIGKRKTKDMEEARNSIMQSNKVLQNMLQGDK